MGKSELRKILKNKISSLSNVEKLEKSKKLSEQLHSFLKANYKSQELSKLIIGGYAPMFDEVDYLHHVKNLVSAFPRILSEREMVFCQSSFDELNKVTLFNKEFYEPSEDMFVVKPLVYLVPGLAFDRTGNRLGRGKGYYDKYLENVSGYKIGLCFHEQLIDEVPVDEFDQQMDVIITNEEVVEVNRREK